MIKNSFFYFSLSLFFLFFSLSFCLIIISLPTEEKKNSKFLFLRLRILYTNFATTNSRTKITSLQRLFFRSLELLIVFDRCQPETELICKVMTSTSGTVTLYEWCCSEIFKARTRTCQRLTTTLGSGSGVLWFRNR